MKKSLIISPFLIGVFFAFSVYAQQEDNQLWVAYKHNVKPDKMDEYMNVWKRVSTECKKHNFPYKYYAWQSTFPEIYYFFPVEDYNTPQEINNEFWKLMEKVEPGFGTKVMAGVESWDSFFLRRNDNLSYDPEESVEGLIHGEWLMRYYKTGTGSKIRNTFKQINEKLKESNAEYPVGRFYGDIGLNGPVIITIFWGKNATDLNKHRAKTWEDFGEEGQKLIQNLNPITRKVERVSFNYMEELSYTAE